jgi:hypothetical protein
MSAHAGIATKIRHTMVKDSIVRCGGLFRRRLVITCLPRDGRQRRARRGLSPGALHPSALHPQRTFKPDRCTKRRGGDFRTRSTLPTLSVRLESVERARSSAFVRDRGLLPIRR